MVRNHKLAKAISDVGWGMFVVLKTLAGQKLTPPSFRNFLSYKLEREGQVLVEIDRWFPSSKTCSECLYQIDELPLSVREWTCPSCGTCHDRDENAAINIRAEGIRMLALSAVEGLTVLGTRTAADGGGSAVLGVSPMSDCRRDVRPKQGRKSVLRHSPLKSEAHT